MIAIVVISIAFLTFENAGASVWKENEDCHLCGMKKGKKGVSNGDDGKVDTGIVVNGTAVKNPGNKYPFIVSIFIKGKFLCTGALITNRYILTASHCLTKGDDSNSEKMETKHLTVELAYDENSGKKVNVSKIILHPDYYLDAKGFKHDIGLLKLKDKFKCSKIAYPICVTEKDRERMGKKLRIAGFGHNYNSERTEKINHIHLKKGDVTQVASKVCKKAGPNTGPEDSIVCGVSKHTKQITCEGDSGAPLFWKFRTVYYALGVTSAISGGGNCVSDAKSTFSKVYYYKDWLKKEVGELPKPHRK